MRRVGSGSVAGCKPQGHRLRGDLANSGDEDTATTTGSSSFQVTANGFTWERSTTKYETGGDESSDSSGSFESKEDRSDDDEPVESESDESEEDEEGESNWKITGQDKVTFDNTRIVVQLNGVSVRTRHEESTVKTGVDEENSREQLTETWTEGLFARSASSGNVVTVNVDEKGQATKTFTTAGDDPGDLQSLKITREIDRTEKTHTNYADKAISYYSFDASSG